MKKAKGQTVSIIALILISAMLFNLWLMLAMDYKANFERYHDKLNAEHVTLALDGERKETRDFLIETLSSDSKVSEYELNDCMSMAGTFPYNGGQMNGWFIFLSKDIALSRSVGKAEITEESKYTSGVYLPLLYKSDEIKVGSSIEITIGGYELDYTICGFFNSIMLGSHNCSVTEIILSEDKYSELEFSNFVPHATLCSVRLFNIEDNQSFEAELSNRAAIKFPSASIMTNSYDNVIQARYISQMICSGIIAAMAFFVLLIALIVLSSNIINFIQENMKKLGSLKAIGYTSRQLICSLLLQFLNITLISTIGGIGLSYALFPMINSMMISQTGIPYAIHFLPVSALISLIILGGTVALSVWLSSRKIKKIEPIVALRSDISTHNFKKNHVPLEKQKFH